MMLDDRFWSKVDKSSHPQGCWIWTATKNNKGYGLFRPGGLANKEAAHRLSFEAVNGRIPRGRWILHSCDNPACVNPRHLRIGTPKENVADMDKRGRRVKAPRPGESNSNAFMTEQDVGALRRDYINGADLEQIAARYSISPNSLADYTTGRSWQHILGKNGCPTLSELKAENRRRRRSNARLSQELADEIRAKLAAGAMGKNLAVEYGVHKTTISDIKQRKIWA